jgi:hypothetical protein
MSEINKYAFGEPNSVLGQSSITTKDDEMLIDYKKQLEIISNIRNGKIKEALKLDIPELDEYFRFKTSNFNIVLGHANVGKTTVVLYLMLCYSLKHDMKWLICSTENDSYSLIRKLIEFLDETPINLVSEANFKTHSEFINRNFKFVDNSVMYDYQSAIELFKNVKKDFNYNGVLLDPYNALTKNQDLMKSLGGHEYDYLACTEMRMFCKESKITLWLNTHANTSALRMTHSVDHEFHRHAVPPNASDVEGGGKFVNRADDFIVIHRYLGHETLYTTTMIHVRKVKEIETGGRTTSIDNPIRLVALQNNVGFSMNGKSILRTIKESQLNFL